MADADFHPEEAADLLIREAEDVTVRRLQGVITVLRRRREEAFMVLRRPQEEGITARRTAQAEDARPFLHLL